MLTARKVTAGSDTKSTQTRRLETATGGSRSEGGALSGAATGSHTLDLLIERA